MLCTNRRVLDQLAVAAAVNITDSAVLTSSTPSSQENILASVTCLWVPCTAWFLLQRAFHRTMLESRRSFNRQLSTSFIVYTRAPVPINQIESSRIEEHLINHINMRYSSQSKYTSQTIYTTRKRLIRLHSNNIFFETIALKSSLTYRQMAYLDSGTKFRTSISQLLHF